MTYEEQRKILAYVRSHFRFRADRFYYFDLKKTDLEKSCIVYHEYISEKAFEERNLLAQKSNEFNIIVMPNPENEITLGVNGDGFSYYENLTTGEIEYDNCDVGPIDLVQLKLEFMQLKRELNRGKVD